MSRDSICDFVLSITTSNVVQWDKNVKSMFQEEVNEANVQYVGGSFGSPKTEGFLPISALRIRFGYERNIQILFIDYRNEPTPPVKISKQMVGGSTSRSTLNLRLRGYADHFF
jgi:hypothetical protein